MDAPTAAEVQEWTNLAELKAAPLPTAERIVARANALFTRITGQQFVNVVPGNEPMVQQAVQGLSESMWFDQSEEQLETLSDWHLIQSFSAGPYSETRRSADDARKARMIHPWPWLNTLLWGLLTDEQMDYWIAFFSDELQIPPAFEVSEVDWSGGSFGEFGTAPGGIDQWRD